MDKVTHLVLGRCVGERILVECGGVEIWIDLAKILDSDRARIGIEAPRHVRILREEIIGKDAA